MIPLTNAELIDRYRLLLEWGADAVGEEREDEVAALHEELTTTICELRRRKIDPRAGLE